MTFDDIQVASLSAKTSDFSTSRGSIPDKTVFHARVLDFHAGKAMLEVDGRVVTADSEVPLKLNSEFDLVVRGSSTDGKISLQVLGARETETAPVRPLTDGMISSRLMGFDLAEHTSTVPAARALMNYGVPVTKANMEVLLAALPKGASQQIIDFAASLLREELPLTREIINLIPQMTRELDALPDTMKAVAEKAALPMPTAETPEARPQDDSAGAGPAKTDAATIEILKNLAGLPADDKTEILERLPYFIKSFLHSTEARLNALADTAPAQALTAAERADFIDRLVSLVKVIPDIPPQETGVIDKAVDTLLSGIRTADISDSRIENIRAELLMLADAAMRDEGKTPPERLAAVRESAAQAISKAMETHPQVSVPAPDDGPSLFNRMVSVLAESTGDTVTRFTMLSQMFSAPEMSPDIMKNEILTLLSKLSLLQSFQFDSDKMPELKQFMDAAGKWAESTAELIARNISRGGESARELIAKIAADPENAALLERLRDMLETTSLRRELDIILKNFPDLPDLRMALSRGAADSAIPQQAASELSRGLQFANFANLAQNTGTMRMDAFVTYFPIQVGNRVEMGKLKIFRRDDDSSRRRENQKPLNPFDAKMVLILDTEFLGLSTLSFRTFKDKSISCDIEVQDKRRQKILDNYAVELREGLESTSYKRSMVTVRVRKRRDKNDSPGENKGFTFSSVDIRI